MVMTVIRDLIRVATHHPAKAAAIVYWFATRRTMRARGRLAEAVAALPFIYEHWLQDRATNDETALANLNPPNLIAVHLHIDAEADYHAAIASIFAQVWPHWELIVTQEGSNELKLPFDPRIINVPGRFASRVQGLDAALTAARSNYIVPLAHDCLLPPEALGAYALHISRLSPTQRPILYGDQDEIREDGQRSHPWFKPDWDADMLLAQDYVSLACALPVASARSEVHSLAGEEPIFALLLRLAVLGDHAVEPVHRVTATTPPERWRQPACGRLIALREIVADKLRFTVEDGPFGTAVLKWPLPDTLPLVSIIVPTRDRVDILEPCIESILKKTTYPKFEIVIADNGSVEPTTVAFFQNIAVNPRIRIVPWPHPYNYSAINNFAVGEARGSYICLLNNDTEVLNGEWLSELMRHACRPGVGAVGARLLYPDRSIQHAGVAVGIGNAAGHAHRGLAEGEHGYFAHALIAREATALTAACLVVAKSLFDAVDGLDENDLRIAYNDVDFCLKLRGIGVRNIYAPTAVLIHHESKSRGQDMAPEHRARYLKELATLQDRWDTMHFQDPTHHPALDRFNETYVGRR